MLQFVEVDNEVAEGNLFGLGRPWSLGRELKRTTEFKNSLYYFWLLLNLLLRGLSVKKPL